LHARGERVVHPAFGPGVVRAVLDGGRKLRVEFERLMGIPYVLPVEQFEPPAKAAPAAAAGPVPVPEVRRKAKPPAPPPAALPAPAAAAPRADIRQLFEALRMGVVPPALLDRYTVGRDGEIAKIRSFLDGRRGILVLEGHYGTGKTHIIELAASEARARGFVTSRVSFDPVEIPPSNPLRIYRELIHNLRFPPDGAIGGLAPLLSRLVRSKPHRTPGSGAFHRYLSPALFASAEGDPDTFEAVLAFIEGRGDTSGAQAERALRTSGWRGPSLLALPDYRTFGQVYLHVIGGIAAWSEDAGYRGLAVLFDEAESMDSLESTSRDFADTFLRYFAAATLPAEELPFRVEDLYRGGQEVHRLIPHVYRPGQPLAAIFAFTPLASVADAIAIALGGCGRIVPLEPLPPGELPLLAERLIGLYQELHSGLRIDRKAAGRFLAHVRRGVRDGALATTRSVARLTVEYLDLIRHRPEDAAKALEPLDEVFA